MHVSGYVGMGVAGCGLVYTHRSGWGFIHALMDV